MTTTIRRLSTYLEGRINTAGRATAVVLILIAITFLALGIVLGFYYANGRDIGAPALAGLLMGAASLVLWACNIWWWR